MLALAPLGPCPLAEETKLPPGTVFDIASTAALYVRYCGQSPGHLYGLPSAPSSDNLDYTWLPTLRRSRSHHHHGPIPSRLGAILGLVLAEEYSTLLTEYRPVRGSEDESPVTNHYLRDPPVRSMSMQA